jgi:hypothetical protein
VQIAYPKNSFVIAAQASIASKHPSPLEHRIAQSASNGAFAYWGIRSARGRY